MGTGKGQRDSKGRFVKGHKGGPGRPALRAYHHFREQLLECVSDADFRKVARGIVTRAIKGEKWAVMYLGDHLLGRPKQPLEIDGRLDVGRICAEEADRYLGSPEHPEDQQARANDASDSSEAGDG